MVKSKLAGRVLASMLAVALVALVGVFAFSQAPEANAAITGETEKAKWDNFKGQVAGGGTIELDQDIVAFDGPVEVSSSVTIVGNGTIYRNADDASFPIFSVVNGGSLTLAEDVKLTGDQKKITGGSGAGGCDAGTPPSGGTSKSVLYFEQSYPPRPFVVYVKGKGFVGPDGYTPVANEAQPFVAVNGGMNRAIVTPESANEDVESYPGKALTIIDGEYKIVGYNDSSDIPKLEADPDSVDRFMINGAYLDATTYDASDRPSDCQGGEQVTDVSCPTYTNDTFGSGNADAPKGFFVEVEAGGTATLDGATLTKFVTDGSVHHAAPVVVKGGTFDIKDGSITGNSVGYAAKSAQSSDPAHVIGKESEQGDGTYFGYLEDWAPTETAGAVIYTDGASGEITGGSVADNRGDTGGILVQGIGNNEADPNSTQAAAAQTAKFEIKGGSIESNVGLHHGGGMTVFNGGAAKMTGGEIKENFSWHKGGGVFVSEEAFATMKAAELGGGSHKVGDADFIMDGGTISGNVAIHRGGGIEVASNHVVLLSGKISNNNSRTLGGGIYVEGDAGRMYQLYIESGCITGNNAYSATTETAKAVTLAGPDNTCEFNNGFAVSGEDVTYRNGFWGEQGDGGGLWLCPLGGNGTFALDLQNAKNVVISGNSSEAPGSGKDIFITAVRADAAGNGINVLNIGDNRFKIEDTNNYVQENRSYAGPLALVNDPAPGCDGKVQISGNSAVNGGGIAANGTVIFGDAKDTYRSAASLKVTKTWEDGMEPKPVTLKLYAEIDGQRISFTGQYDPLAGTEVTLNGTPDVEEEGYKEEATTAYESEAWVAEMALPLTVVLPDGTQTSLFTVNVAGEDLDPGNPADLEKIKNASDPASASATNWNLVIEETDADTGEVLTYTLPAGDVVLDTVEAITDATVTYRDIDGNTIAGPVSTYTVKMNFSNAIENTDVGPEIEKYVNDKVHADVDLDEEFTYSIFAYVTKDADKVTITDELVGDLQFAFAAGDAATKVKVEDWGEGKKNNPPAATAEKGANAIDSVVATKAVSGQTLTVTITNELEEVKDADGNVTGVANTENNQNVTPLRGHWVKVTFDAKYAENKKVADVEKNYVSIDEAAANEDRATPNVGNDPTGVEGSHEGTANTASYEIEVGNKSEYSDESNTVTVKPVEPTIEKYVAKDVHAEVEIGQEYDYDILVYVPKNADSIEINDTLEPSLALVSTKADIEGSVVVKKTNDHKVNGTVAGGEASDAKVSAVATISGQSIKVEIADAKAARGQYVQVTFKAKVTADAEHVTIEDNGTVLEGAASHEGIPNDATYKIKVGNEWSSDYESNTVTVKPKPEEPAIEKYVNKNVHKDIEIDEEFTYDILAYITKDADEATITDTLEGILEFATDASAVTVVDLGEEEPDHTPNGSVAKDGTPVTGAVPAINGQTLTVTIADTTALRGHWVKVTFDAKVKAGTKASDLGKAYKTISNNDPVITDEEHTGIPNTASYEIRVKNESGVAEKKYEKPSNTVTVKPDVEVPELEKYIAQDVHLADVEEGATFTYDIVAYVAKDADEIEITDVLNANLDFASAEGDVKVADLGTTNNHNTNGDFTAKNDNATVASAGTAIDANVAISGKTLTVGITDIASKDLRGHYVRVTFDAKIAQDAGYEKVDDNGTVNSDKSHEGIPNKASYRTKVGNDWNSDYDLESNVVTVTPNKPDEPKPEEPKPENPTPGDNPQPEETLSAEASTVTKTWADGGNDKDRDNVEFQLYRKVGDGAWEIVQGKTVTLTSEDSDGLTTWTGHFDNLPAYEGGQKVSYRAAEANSADFEGLYVPDTDEEIIIVDVDSTSGMGATNHPFTPNTSVDISKQEVGGGPELPGATLIVRDAEGNEIARWVSGTEPHSLTLEPGVYTLTEVTAPNGYDVAETMTFRVNVDGTIELLQNGEWLSVEDHIVMFDAPTTPGKPDNPKTPTPGKPTNPGTPTTSKAPTPTSSARTADAVGGATVALLLAAVLGAGGVAYAGSRSRTSRKK